MSDRKKTILIVEDEVIIALSEKAQLERESYRVLLADSGEKAIDFVCARREPVDLILMDIDLGSGMDGTEAAKEILKYTDVPLLFLSSHTEKEIVERTESITNYGYVVKNSSFTVLDASIKMAFKLFGASKRVNEERMKNEAAYEEMQVINDSLLRTQEDLLETEKNLRQSEERYRYIDESSLDSIYSYDRQGHFTHANRALCRLLGRPREDIIGKTHAELGFPKGQCEEWAALHQRVFDTNSTVIAVTETPIPDSQSVYCEVVLNPIHGRDGEIIGISGTTRDITERKKAEQALRDNERQYLLLAESMSDVIWVLDMATRRLAYISPSIVNLRGLSVDEALSEPFEASMTQDSLGRLMAEIEKGLVAYLRDPEAPTQILTEIQQPRKNGDLIWVEVATRIRRGEDGEIEVVGVSRNIEDRKREEKRIREAKEKFSKIFDHSPYPVMIVDTRDGSFYDVNEAMEKGLGYSREELLGKTAVELGIIPLEHVLQTKGQVEQFGQYSDIEVSIRTKSGQVRDGLVTGRSIELEGHVYLVQAVVDITERKNAEAVLKETQERLCFALEGSELGEWDWDLVSNTVIRNSRWAEMLGYSAAEIDGGLEQGRELQHPDDRERIKREIQDHLEGRADSYKIEYRMRKKNGDYLWIRDCGKIMERDADGRPVRICGTHADIDKKKRAEELVEASQGLLQSILDSSPDVIVFALDKDYRYLAFNEKHKETIKSIWGKEPAVGMSMLEVFGNHDDRRKAKEGMDRALRGESFVVPEEYGDEALSRQSSLDYWSPLMAGDGEIIGLACYVLDNTAQKQAEQVIKALLSEKELVLKEVHHRIKNNMEMIKGLLSFQLEKVADAVAKAALEDWVSRIQSMSLLYDKLYRSSDYSELSVQAYLPTLVDEVVANVLEGRRVRLEKTIEDFILDAKRLQCLGIIINELLTNCLKYAFKGRASGLISVSALSANGHISVSVQDDGNGLPESVNFKESTGFGLQLVHALTQQLKGSVRIERAKGTKVVVEFEA